MLRDESQNRSVGIATACGLDGLGLNPNSERLFSSPQRSRPSVGPAQPPIQWIPRALSPGLMPQGLEVDHSPASIAEVKNDGAIPPFSHMSSWHNA
jgi:hypothetical protein